MLKLKPENSTPVLSAVDILILIVHVSVGTVSQWRSLHLCFAHLKKYFDLAISKMENSVLKWVLFSLKLPIQDEMDFKKKNNYVLTSHLKLGPSPA